MVWLQILYTQGNDGTLRLTFPLEGYLAKQTKSLQDAQIKCGSISDLFGKLVLANLSKQLKLVVNREIWVQVFPPALSTLCLHFFFCKTETTAPFTLWNGYVKLLIQRLARCNHPSHGDYY